MASQKPVGIGFIGAGEISLLHAKAVKAIPGATLVGLWNRTQSRASERAALYGCRNYATPLDLVKDPEIDAVFILTDLDTHLEYARLAMEHGKHVLVEKPLAATVAEVEEMKAIAERQGVVIVPGFNMVHEASLARAKTLIANGDIGKVVSCYVMYNIHHSEERASTLPGMVRHILSHNIYTMMYLVGRPTRATAMKAMRHYEQITQEDLAMVLLDLECGGIAHLCASFAADDLSADPWTFMVKVIGTAGHDPVHLPGLGRGEKGHLPLARLHGLPGDDHERGSLLRGCLSEGRPAVVEHGRRDHRAEDDRGGGEVHR